MTLLLNLRRLPFSETTTVIQQLLARQAGGFTLIELAVVLFILTLLLSSLLVPLATQVDQRNISDTQKAMDEIKEALIGYAVANRSLPCPDTNGDGIADPATPPNVPAGCPNNEGFLPWVTLNVAQADAWGIRFLYRVSPEFTGTPVTPCAAGDGRLGLCDVGNITINTRDAATKATQTMASNVAAVILSYGKNGRGGTSTSGIVQAAPVAGTDEATNANPAGTTVFISRTLTTAQIPCSDTVAGQPFCEFDDIIIWVSPSVLMNRLVAAGQLP